MAVCDVMNYILNYLIVAMVLYSSGAYAFENYGSQPPPGAIPTDIITRTDLEYKLIDSPNDTKTHALVARFDYAFTPDILFRADIPFLNTKPYINELDDETGIGDLFVRVGWQARHNTKFTLFFSGDIILDTATENLLGDGTYIATPLAAAAWVLPSQGAIAGFTLSQSFDIGGSDRQDINDTELHHFYVKTLPKGAWLSLDTHWYIDWKDDNQFGWFQEFQLGKMLSRNFGLTLTPGIGIIGDNHEVPDWQIKGVIRYLFCFNHKMDKSILNCTRCHYE